MKENRQKKTKKKCKGKSSENRERKKGKIEKKKKRYSEIKKTCDKTQKNRQPKKTQK
jgi:hypothetical protein